MGGGNGAKAAQARTRNDALAKKGPTSQLKTNAAALTIMCDVCRQTFQSTSKQPILEQHVQNKHAGKADMKKCFPNFVTA